MPVVTFSLALTLYSHCGKKKLLAHACLNLVTSQLYIFSHFSVK